MSLMEPERYFAKYCWCTLNIISNLLHMMKLYFYPIRHAYFFFLEWLFCFLLMTIFLNMYDLKGEENKNKNLSGPVFFRRLYFYGHLELFNYLFFALLASFFPKPQMSVPTHLLLCFLRTPCSLRGLYSSPNLSIWVRWEFYNLLSFL